MSFGSPPPQLPPPPPKLPPLPTPDNPAVRAARDTVRRRAKLSGGRASTIKTSPQGLQIRAPTAPKTLLGQ